jgi:hydrogenase expression/formation protein HypC
MFLQVKTMCLAVPAKLISIEGDKGIVDYGGVKREVMLTLLRNVKVGDYVIVHIGYAIEVLNKKEAEKTLKLWREVLASERAERNR